MKPRSVRGRVSAMLLTLAAMSMLIISCAQEQKIEPVQVGEMTEYRDPGIGFAISHPAGWIVSAEVGRAHFYNEQEVSTKFLDPTSVGPLGVMIAVDLTKVADVAAAMRQFKTDLEQTGVVLGPEQSVKVGDRDGVKIPYTANYGGGNIIYGHHVLLPADSAYYDLGFAGFGDYYNAYAAIFDASLNSFKMPKPKEKGRDETLPSETMTSYDAKMFAFMYPENFNFVDAAKGKYEMVVMLQGVRLDASIRFDVFGAQGLTVEKVFDQNKGTYRAKSTGTTSVGGEKAMYINYSARGDVDSRVYFIVRNDKVVRITMNWFKPQTEQYLPVYEQVIGSVRFK